MASPDERGTPRYFVLEVVKIMPTRCEGFEKLDSRACHSGYMRLLFSTKDEAATYYNTYNPHMPPISKASRWKSEWNRFTGLMFIVREDHGLNRSIPPFATEDTWPDGREREEMEEGEVLD